MSFSYRLRGEEETTLLGMEVGDTVGDGHCKVLKLLRIKQSMESKRWL